MKQLLALSALLLFLGCSNPADSVPAAAVGPASTPAADAAEPATSDASEVSQADAIAADATGSSAPSDSSQPATSASMAKVYVFGPQTSKIEFTGSKITGSHDGGFKEFTGELRVQDGEIADDGIRVEIVTDSLWSDSDRLTGHLKNQDFFEVETYPTATFVSTAVEPSDGGATISGDLTLHGVTKSISFPAQVEVASDKVRLQSEFSINRFDFDIKYSGKADDAIRKEVVIRLDMNAMPTSSE